MTLSLIICTYMRPEAICVLLDSVLTQTKVPDEIVIIDGSTNDLTKEMIESKNYSLNIRYFLVDKENRGLTKQRNYGVQRVQNDMELIAFLDDDIRLNKNYFYELEKPYLDNDEVVGVGGRTTNETIWKKLPEGVETVKNMYCIDGFMKYDSLRYRTRSFFGLVPDTFPGISSSYSHERPAGFLPPSGKCYEVDFMMGGIASFRKVLFDKIGFSHYFEGYGLYEDKDFTLRASRIGKLLVNTNAELEHLHDPSGRPNKFYYGTMVIRNGWYVWKVAIQNPGLEGNFKWYINAFLLTLIRFTNILTGPSRQEALTETAGRVYGLLSLIWNRPKVQD